MLKGEKKPSMYAESSLIDTKVNVFTNLEVNVISSFPISGGHDLLPILNNSADTLFQEWKTVFII